MPAALLIAAALAALAGAAFPSQLPQPSSSPTPPTAGMPRQDPPPAPNARVFGSTAGIVFNPIKPDKTADFELVMKRLRSALANNPDPVRKKQGAGWNVYKVTEPYEGTVLYLFVIDPAVPSADYTVSRILAETYPADVQDLYVKFRDAYAAGQTLWNMTPIAVAPPAVPR
jgi:hypothetical protein